MRTKIAASFICLLFTAATLAGPAKAQTNLGQELGVTLAKEVGKFLFGKGMTEIFGSDALTKKDLDEALTRHFDEFKLDEIHSDVSKLKTAVTDFNYSSTANLQLVGPDLANVFGKVTDIKGAITREMSAAHFWSLLPNYVFTINIQLAFLAHKHKLDPEGGWDTTAANVAVAALKQLYDYFDNNFIDSTPRKCLHKSHHTKLFTVRGQDTDYQSGWGIFISPTYASAGVATDPKRGVFSSYDLRNPFNRQAMERVRKQLGNQWPSRTICIRNPKFGFMAVDVPINSVYIDSTWFPHPNFFGNHRVFRHPHHGSYYFTYKSPNDGKYKVSGPWKHETDARVQRVRYAIKAFPEQLGDVRSAAKEWLRIVLESHVHHAKSEVRQTALDLFLMHSDGKIRE